jgi:hypothetical protein
MRPTLEEALLAVSGADAAAGPDAAGTDVEARIPGAAVTATVADALEVFERGNQALQEGDWAAYGEAQEELQQILEVLAESESGVQVVVPEAAGTPVP